MNTPSLSQKLAVPLSILTREQYYEDLAKRISKAKAGERVVVVTMSFKPERTGLEAVVDALCAAAEQGATVDLIVDAYPFIINDVRPGPLFFHRSLPHKLAEPYRTRQQVLKRLEAAGGRTTIINWPSRPFRNPFGGRSHLKLAIIGDYAYTGGCNLNPRDHIDVMVGLSEARSVDWLYERTQEIIKAKSVKNAFKGSDKSFKIDETTDLLIDAGTPGQSTIYRKALELIDSADKELLITCQYFPNGSTIDHLHLAQQRGVKVKIIYGRPGQHPFPMNLLHHSVKQFERRRRPASFFAHELPKDGRTLHAKVLISEKAAMVGSHNYVPAGVRWGTAEIALHSTDIGFRTRLKASIDQEI